MSSSRFAPVQQMAWTLSCRIISASERPEFGGAHRAGHRHEHLAARCQMRLVGLGGIDQRGGVEVTIVVLDKRSDC